MAKEKKFRMKKALRPADPSMNGLCDVTLRWRESSPMGSRQLQKTIGPDDVLVGEQWAQFVPEFLEEIVPEKKTKAVESDESKDDEKSGAEDEGGKKAKEPKPSGKTSTRTISREK